MITEKQLENWKSGEMVDEPISWPDVVKTLSLAWTVIRAAQKVVRMGYRQNREDAPLEYALWEALAPFDEKEKS